MPSRRLCQLWRQRQEQQLRGPVYSSPGSMKTGIVQADSWGVLHCPGLSSGVCRCSVRRMEGSTVLCCRGRMRADLSFPRWELCATVVHSSLTS